MKIWKTRNFFQILNFTSCRAVTDFWAPGILVFFYPLLTLVSFVLWMSLPLIVFATFIKLLFHLLHLFSGLLDSSSSSLRSDLAVLSRALGFSYIFNIFWARVCELLQIFGIWIIKIIFFSGNKDTIKKLIKIK